MIYLVKFSQVQLWQDVTASLPALPTHRNFLKLFASHLQIIVDNVNIIFALLRVPQLLLGSIEPLSDGGVVSVPRPDKRDLS